MLSVRFVMRPERFTLYYDTPPRDSATWRCACAIADACVLTPSRTAIHGAPLVYPQHRSDLMRLDLLEKYGGVYIDHDSFALRPLDDLRKCGAPVIGGREQFSADEIKFNNGVLLAVPNATFLRLWRASYRDYRPEEWDYNSCRVPAQLWRQNPSLALALPGIAPLLRYGEQASYDAHLRRAHVVHVTGLFNAPWRQEDVRKFKLMRAIAGRVMAAVRRAPPRASHVARCAEIAAAHVDHAW